MKRNELFQTLLAGAGAFAAVAAVGLAVLPGPARPAAPAGPVSSALSATPAAQSAASPAPASPAPTPGAAPAAKAFAFTGEEFLRQAKTDLGHAFLYTGSFSEQGVYVSWAALDGLDFADPEHGFLRLAAYSTAENGPVQAVTVKGSLEFAQAVSSALRQCTGMRDVQKPLQTLVAAGSYQSPTLQASLNAYSVTLLPVGGSLQQASLDDLSWGHISVLNRGSDLFAQLQKLNIEYRHEELAQLLEAALPEEQRAQDPFLPEALELARRAAVLEAACSIDRTLPSEPILRYPGAEALTRQISFSPYLSPRGLRVQAGFYSAGSAGFTSVQLSSGDLHTSDTCGSNDVTPAEDGLFLKSSGNLFSSDYSLRNIARMEAPAARFSSGTNPQLYDHVLTQPEIDAFHTLYELYQLKTYLHSRSVTYSSIT